jgi:curved DNA-binding protein CbpA
MAPVPITEDYYMILEVEQTATPELITQSYRRLALKVHPDRNRDAKHDTTEAFQLVCEFSGQR